MLMYPSNVPRMLLASELRLPDNSTGVARGPSKYLWYPGVLDIDRRLGAAAKSGLKVT